VPPFRVPIPSPELGYSILFRFSPLPFLLGSFFFRHLLLVQSLFFGAFFFPPVFFFLCDFVLSLLFLFFPAAAPPLSGISVKASHHLSDSMYRLFLAIFFRFFCFGPSFLSPVVPHSLPPSFPLFNTIESFVSLFSVECFFSGPAGVQPQRVFFFPRESFFLFRY